MSVEKKEEEFDFSIPPINQEIKKKRKIKKGWIIFAIVVFLIVVLLYFSKPYIADYLNGLFESIGHPDGLAYPID